MRGGAHVVPQYRPAWRLLLLSLILLAAGAGLPASAQTTVQALPSGPADLESPIAAFVRAAADRAALGDWAGAARIIAGAVDADAADSDALYFAALAVLKTRDDAGAALSLCEAALASDSFALYGRGEALDLAASLLVRMRRYADCLDLLGRASGSGDGALDPERYRLRTLAFMGLGRQADALRELRSAADRFPADPRFARLYFERLAAGNPSPESRALGDLFVRRLPSLASSDPGLLVLGAPCILDSRQREDAIRAFRAQGGRSALATLEALRYGVIGDEAALSEFFPASYPLRLSDLESLAGLLGTAAGRQQLSSLLGRYSGRILADRDGDGYAEETASYEGGRLVSWTRDADQDGLVESSLSFGEGLPVELVASLEDSRVVARYAAYPYVASLEFRPRKASPGLASLLQPLEPAADAEAGETYSFAPEAFMLKPLSFRAFPSASDPAIFLPEPLSMPAPTRSAAGGAALRLELSKEGLREEIDLDHGIPLRRTRFLDGKAYSVLVYARGMPGQEKVDADGDGRFETLRGYMAGADASDAAIAWVKIDADGDGIFEYREDLTFPFRKEWDLDSNGSVDAAEYRDGKGGRVLEFSSRLDGNLDEAVTYDAAGQVTAVTRNGRPLALVRDANPAIYWLGRKEFDLGSNAPVREGIYSYMNRRYRIVYSGLEAFAELLP